MATSRRQFLAGCSAAIASLAGARFQTLAFAADSQPGNTLVVVFLRGGMDGLMAFPPLDGADRGFYETARPSLKIPTTGPGSALELAQGFGLHPAAAPLLDLFRDGGLALVQAAGMADVNRSHFDAMQLIEMGAAAGQHRNAGWLTRHLAVSDPQGQMTSLAVGDLQPASLLGSFDTVNFAYPEYFNFRTGLYEQYEEQKSVLRSLYGQQQSWLHDSARNALNAVEIVESNLGGDYTPANGASYPDSELGSHLRVVAQLIKQGLGLQIATVDFGGWDTHEGQGTTEGPFADLLGDLASSLFAFYADLDLGGSNSPLRRTTVVVQSEFGRELRENSDGGTEHGYGNTMMVLGGEVIGGLHGEWPGLHPEILTDGTDLPVTTDYRRVFAEILIRRLANPRLGDVFPGYADYSPLGVVHGQDLDVA